MDGLPTTRINQETKTKDDISIYPNPSNGIFTISSNEKVNSIEIYNALGVKMYFSNVYQSSSNEIDLNESPKGIYFINVYHVKKLSTKKIVIE